MGIHNDRPWYDADLYLRLRMGHDYLCGILNPDSDNWPYFFYGRHADGTAGGAGELDALPHAVGRGMELMLNFERYTGEKPPRAVEEAYTRHFYEEMDEELGISTYPDKEQQRSLIHLHNQRETIEAFALLIQLRDDPHARQLVEKMYAAFERITDKETGCASLEKAEQNGIADRFMRWTLVCEQPMTMGRLTGPLMQLYRVTGDKRALEWAGCYAKGTLDIFTDEGVLTEKSGTHVHSITSSMSGAADYALTVGDHAMLEKLKRALVHPEGIRGLMTSYGWVKEQVRVPNTRQGECNQIGDLLQLRLTLAQYERPAYWYGTVEHHLRSMLLPAQIQNPAFIREKPTATCDADREITRRAMGGFGFPMPAAHLEWDWSAINSLDITQGACQAIVAVMEHIVQRREDGLQINLLFDHCTPEVEVCSELPVTGHVSVLPHQSGSLRLRVPNNIEPDSLRITLRGEPTVFTLKEGYALLPEVPAGCRVDMYVTPTLSQHHEQAIGMDYTVQCYGEQVISVTPIEGVYPLYGDFPLPQDIVFHHHEEGGDAT